MNPIQGKASLSSVQVEDASIQGLSTTHCKVQSPTPPRPFSLPLFNLPETLSNVSRYHADYFRCEDGESANVVKTRMECEWCNV